MICLYFTVVVDQAMYTYYPYYYPRFEELTKYPKFCHVLGQFQKNPRAILFVPVDQGFVDYSAIETHLHDGMNLFVDEVDSFFEKYMPSIKASDFFDKLICDPDVQIPELLVILNEDLKNDIVYKTYKALRSIVEKKYADKVRF